MQSNKKRMRTHKESKGGRGDVYKSKMKEEEEEAARRVKHHIEWKKEENFECGERS